MSKRWRRIVKSVAAGISRQRSLNISAQYGRVLTPEEQECEHEEVLAISKEWRGRAQPHTDRSRMRAVARKMCRRAKRALDLSS